MFSDVKSTHILSLSVPFFATSTWLASQVAILISRMKFAANNRLISSPIALRLGSEHCRMACCTGLTSLKTSSECSVNSLGTPGMSAGTHAKIFPVLTEEFDERAYLYDR